MKAERLAWWERTTYGYAIGSTVAASVAWNCYQGTHVEDYGGLWFFAALFAATLLALWGSFRTHRHLCEEIAMLRRGMLDAAALDSENARLRQERERLLRVGDPLRQICSRCWDCGTPLEPEQLNKFAPLCKNATCPKNLRLQQAMRATTSVDGV